MEKENNYDWIQDLRVEILKESLASLKRVDEMISLLMKVLAQENFNTKIVGILTQNYWRLGDNLADFHAVFQKWRIKIEKALEARRKKIGFQPREPPK